MRYTDIIILAQCPYVKLVIAIGQEFSHLQNMSWRVISCIAHNDMQICLTFIGCRTDGRYTQMQLSRPRESPLWPKEDKMLDQHSERARDIALDLLKPTASQVEHGLDLHANAIVCDTMGFAPHAKMDTKALTAAIEDGASPLEMKDSSEEMSMLGCMRDDAERKAFIERWEGTGVTCIFQNCGEESSAVGVAIKRLARFTHLTDMRPDIVRKAVRADDVVAAKREGGRCFYMSGNGVPIAQAWHSVEEELRYIRVFFQLGIRMMHLTYNRRNMIGDGCAEPADAGLSDFGRRVVAEMNRVGMIVDVAHSGSRTSLDAARVSRYPVVASHSACFELNQHCRCKSDEVIRAIADSGGFIGICCVPAFLGSGGDIRALLDHLEYVAKTFGPDYVAIGTDVWWSAADVAADNNGQPAMVWPRSRPLWENFWPPDEPVHTPAWNGYEQKMSLCWSNWPLFTVGLVQRGFPDDEILKIIGGNALRVARAVLPV